MIFLAIAVIARYIQTGPKPSAKIVTTRPIIGIIAQEKESEHGTTYISKTYVAFLEQAGARVVPIRGGRPREYYEQMVKYTNGILIPGGGANFVTSMYGQSTKHVLEIATEMNKNGDYYPLWGTCLGFQAIGCHIAGYRCLQQHDSVMNGVWPLDFTKDAFSSKLFKEAPKEIMQYLATENITQNYHKFSILLETFYEANISSVFTILSTNTDTNGLQFVSTMEAKQFPFYATQWHPEKSNFSWGARCVVNHDDHAVKVSQYMANFFVGEARKSDHHFPDIETEAREIIQNYKLVYIDNGSFEENYHFDD